MVSTDSRDLLTVNTHKGLFQPTLLQFRVHSDSVISQREIEHNLTSIPFVKIRLKDTLASGKNDNEHFQDLNQALKVIRGTGMRLKLK